MKYNYLHPFSMMPKIEMEEAEDLTNSIQKSFIHINRGQDCWVYDDQEKPYLYLTTAVPTVGLSNQEIINKMTNQLNTLSFFSTCEQSHYLVQPLAEKLCEKCGPNFNLVSFANDGSGAVETAMRLTRQFFKQQGSKKWKFISFEGSYHGTTFGSGAVTNLGIKEQFGNALEGCITSPSPNLFRQKTEDTVEKLIDYCLEALEIRILDNNPDEIAAVLLEPIQGVNGIIPFPREFIQGVRHITQKYNILLIMDEVTTGIGRCGTFTASQYYGVTPDLLVLSKGLTGGYFPMGATLISKEISRELFSDGGIFLHGSTQSGHPVGCAAALAVLDYIEKYNLIENSREKGTYILESLIKELMHHPNVGDIRGEGLMIAIEFIENESLKTPVSFEWGYQFNKNLQKEGVLGNFFNSILLMYPPLIINKDECDFLIKGIKNALDNMR
ncbi:aminotransferase class III-fold pyridoxal phosphate-dependent enzyme [Bacillus sp. 166amftsu]|uniref:aminotransferase family protein n=1 Tax=Bacillus sp. 166amftsu TaxID=1761753 RepID=UPI000897A2D9|nr:aminotransferase class III-fold pyridoxal phosphate-dependent enzyme [Bacillus sp. 166amftsu]SDZ40605.1 Adenosylmethionine-8-amino-7-oxononanoate aminotransferase [Bacillus sp. 166amftsu]